MWSHTWQAQSHLLQSQTGHRSRIFSTTGALKTPKPMLFWKDTPQRLPPTKTIYTVSDGYTATARNQSARKISIHRPLNGPSLFFALALGKMTKPHDTTLRTLRGSHALSLPGAESIMGPMVSSVLVHVRLPPKQPISMVLRNL